MELFTETGTPCRDPSAFFPLGAAGCRFRSLGPGARAFRIHVCRSIQLRIQSLDPRQMRLHQLHRRNRPARTCSAISTAERKFKSFIVALEKKISRQSSTQRDTRF